MKNEKDKKVELPVVDTNESKILIQGAVQAGEIPKLNEAEAIWNHGGFYLRMCEQFREDNPPLAAAFKWFDHLSPDQRKRLLYVPNEVSDFTQMIDELRLKDQGGHYAEAGPDPVERAKMALKDAKATRSAKNLYAVALAFENPGLDSSVVAAMSGSTKLTNQTMEERVRMAVASEETLKADK